MPARRGPYSPNCLFCRVIAHEQPAAWVLDDPSVDAAAFLDIRPVFPGHTLIVPRSHIEVLSDVPADEIGPFFGTVQRVANAVEAGMEADGTFVAINNRVSQSVPHLHVHVVPRRRKDGLRGFFWPRQRYANDDEREKIAMRIRSRLDG